MTRSRFSGDANTTSVFDSILQRLREARQIISRANTDGGSGGLESSTAVPPALGEFGDRECLPYLQSLLEQDDPDLRRAAHMAISRLRDV
jgi:HEAT repeat protein